mmetsp:Transcript_66361/g.106487  ORF Transcript_66361/g.106487 Transcript_66361/m.106487 type:complete len:85 (-) Transcript_66361:2561-2815(-)
MEVCSADGLEKITLHKKKAKKELSRHKLPEHFPPAPNTLVTDNALSHCITTASRIQDLAVTRTSANPMPLGPIRPSNVTKILLS